MFELLLNYPPEVFAAGELILASDWPRWALFVAFGAGAAAISALLWRKRGLLGPGRLVVIGLLQISMFGVSLVLLWQPSVRMERLRTGDNVVAVMMDTSLSMGYAEESSSRLQVAGSALTGGLLDRLEQDYEIEHIHFAASADAAGSLDTLPIPAGTTKIGDSVLEVLRRAHATPLAAIVLLSDGADNTGRISPSQLQDIGGFGVPVHTIGIGRVRMPEDLELADVLLSERALPGSRLHARVTIRHDGPGATTLKAYDEDRLLATKELELASNATLTTAWLDLELPETGQRNIRFSLEALDGERNLRNNTRRRIVEIPAEPYRILYVEGEPRWEYKFLRRALEPDPTVRLISLLRVSANKLYRQGIDSPEELEDGFPNDRPTLFAYDALIIGSIEAASFTDAQQEMIRDFVSIRGGSLLMLAGPVGLGAGGWGQSSVGEVLPTRLTEDDAEFRRAGGRVRLTDRGRETPMLQFDTQTESNERLWQELPELANHQSVGPSRPAALTLLNVVAGGREQPLLITQPYGRGRSYILATAGTWRWQMGLAATDQRHETFWRQLARDLVANSPRRFELRAEEYGGRVHVEAELRGESFEPLENQAVKAAVLAETGEAYALELQPSRERPGVFAAEFEPRESGLHYIEAIRYGSDNEPEEAARVPVWHEGDDLEFYGIRQNRALLERLAIATGGRYWTLDELGGLPEAIRFSRAGITEQEIRSLWNAPAVFLLLLMIKSLEWGVRRLWRRI